MIDGPTLTVARLTRLLERCETELSVSQYRTLALLAGGGERASKLASKLAVAKPTMTAQIDTLVERGYVERGATSGDRRAVTVTITDAGTAVLDRTGRLLAASLSELIDECADPAAVRAALAMLSEALDTRFLAGAVPAEAKA